MEANWQEYQGNLEDAIKESESNVAEKDIDFVINQLGTVLTNQPGRPTMAQFVKTI